MKPYLAEKNTKGFGIWFHDAVIEHFGKIYKNAKRALKKAARQEAKLQIKKELNDSNN